MPIVRFILTSLIVIAGVIGAVALMIFGLVMFVLNRLFGRAAPPPRFQATFRRTPPRPPANPRRDDVIDVVATEVKDASAPLPPRLNG